jgi:predicted phage terminase large subunit-like protein
LAQQIATVQGPPLRLKSFVDLNPTTRNHWTYRMWRDGVNPEDESPLDREGYVWDQVNPLDNAANLAEDYIHSLRNLPERQRKRFFEGEFSGDDDNALWRREMFKRVTRDADGKWPVAMRRVVVAIDPAASNTPGSDETGIVVVARGADGNAYVLEDGSGRYRPEEWARQAIALYREHGADRIIGEVNNGGDMVEAVIRAQARDVPFTAVHASRGKVIRAEPVAALYERGKVFHAEGMRALEEQCCSFTADFDRKAQGWSPDRVDALVWGMTDLFASLTRKGDGKPIKYGRLANVA